jgi:hypothetical protein
MGTYGAAQADSGNYLGNMQRKVIPRSRLFSANNLPLCAVKESGQNRGRLFSNGCTENIKKQRFRRRDCDLALQRPIFDDIDAEINDREC